MAGGMEAQNHFGPWGMFDAQALAGDGNAAIGADLDRRANAPNIRPPRATRGWAQNRALRLLGQFPGVLRDHAQFPMELVGVVMEPQSVDVGVGGFEFGNVFTGEIGWQPSLPVLVLALDFTFGLGGWGIKEANVVKLEGRAQLGQCLGILREKDGVIIDVDLQRSAVAQESGGQEIEVGQEQFALIEFGADEHAAAIIEHIEHGKVERAAGEPAMGRSIQLPEFADLGALPAPHRGVRAFGHRRMRIPILDGPAADLGPVELEGVQAQGFRGCKAVRTRRGASQAFYEQRGHWLRPGGGVVATGSSRDPQARLLACAGAQVIGEEPMKAATRQAKLFGGFAGRPRAQPEGS